MIDNNLYTISSRLYSSLILRRGNDCCSVDQRRLYHVILLIGICICVYVCQTHWNTIAFQYKPLSSSSSTRSIQRPSVSKQWQQQQQKQLLHVYTHRQRRRQQQLVRWWQYHSDLHSKETRTSIAASTSSSTRSTKTKHHITNTNTTNTRNVPYRLGLTPYIQHKERQKDHNSTKTVTSYIDLLSQQQQFDSDIYTDNNNNNVSVSMLGSQGRNDFFMLQPTKPQLINELMIQIPSKFERAISSSISLLTPNMSNTTVYDTFIDGVKDSVSPFISLPSSSSSSSSSSIQHILNNKNSTVMRMNQLNNLTKLTTTTTRDNTMDHDHDDDNIRSIGTFESNSDFDTLWDTYIISNSNNRNTNSTNNKSNSNMDVPITYQNNNNSPNDTNDKIVTVTPTTNTKLSTQPQSIFSTYSNNNNNNNNSTKKSTTIRNVTLSSSTGKAFQQPPLLLSKTDSLQQHPLLVGKNPDSVITVADLQAILRYNNYYSRPSLSLPSSTSSSSSSFMIPNILNTNKQQQQQQSFGDRTTTSADSSSSTTGSTTASKSSTVAFPQPSTLSYNTIVTSTTISGSIIGLIMTISISFNLWLMGILFGSIYGYETIQKQQQTSLSSSSTESFNVLQSLILYVGRRIANAYIKTYDACQTFFFMYKTGQLSYEYYKTYAALDERLLIQKKIDAWNARFVEGKLAFDKWEKENEVGRKVLATLRTVWLVEERNSKKRIGLLKRSQQYQSRYRVVQFVYDTVYTISNFGVSFWKRLVGEDMRIEVRNFIRGLLTGRDIGMMIRGIILSIATISIIGAIFTISPLFLIFVAGIIGCIWPSWVSEMIERTESYIDDTILRGKDEGSEHLRSKVSKQQPFFQRQHSRNTNCKNQDQYQYHYYRTMDGKKRYYRVGQPNWFMNQFYQFTGQIESTQTTKNIAGPFSWLR